MNRKKQISEGVILSYISIIVNFVIGILYTPIMLSSLGQSQYGVYSLCVSFIGYLTILNAGVNAAYVRFYVQEKTINEKGVEKLNGLFCKIFIVLSIIGFLGGLLVADFSSVIFGLKITSDEYALVKKCFVLLAFTICIEIFTCVFKSFVTANERFVFGKTIDISTSVLYPLLALPLLLTGHDCTYLIAVRLTVAIITLLLHVSFCRKKLSIAFKFVHTEKSLLKNVAQFIGFIALQSIMDQLNWQIDKFILARTHGTAEISIYSVGSTFNTYFITIAGVVSGVFIVQINRLVALKDENRLNDLFRQTCKFFTYMTGFIIIAFYILGRPFVLRWAGENYGKSFTVGRLLMSPVALALIMALGQDIARAKNKHQMQIIINLGVCVVNAIVSIPLAMHWGAIGSAVGTFVAEIIVCVIVQPIYYKRVLNLDVKNVFIDLLRYLRGIVLPIMFGAIVHYLGLIKNSYSSVAFYGVIFAFVYVISVWTVSMNSNDRAMVKNFVMNKLHR